LSSEQTWLPVAASTPLLANKPSEEDVAEEDDTRPVVVACPGLRGTSLPQVTPDVTIVNPAGRTAYGSTARLAESFKQGQYQMPLLPVRTLHSLALVLQTDIAKTVWQQLGFSSITSTPVRPVPFFGTYRLKQSHLLLPWFLLNTQLTW
jgi:hypothetical protein